MRLIWCGLLVSFITGGLFAQDITATIGGTVLDPSGAAVPNAKVTVTNTDRNQMIRQVVTDATGVYSAPLLPIGTYALKVEAPGFRPEERSGIRLNVNDNLKINLSLQVGATGETVNVTATVQPIELGNSTSATTIQGTQVRELSLVTRNYEQLAYLMPGVTASTTDEVYLGVSSPAGTSSQIPYSINGNRQSANNWTVDGADNVDRGSNLTLLTFPSVDAIAEFKVERALYSADTGRAGGGQINVVTKSGTKDFHGNLYEFDRNDAFAANNYFNNANKTLVFGQVRVPPLRWNDFGGTIGGPVYIPGHYNKDRNKTFFFFSEEARRIITYTPFNPTMPTTGMLAGNFTSPVCVSYSLTTASCQQVASQIPASQINPIAAAYIKDIYSKLPLSPVDTIAAQTAQAFAVRNIFNSRQEIARIDHMVNEKLSLWGKIENDSIPTTEPGGLFTGAVIPDIATTNTNSPGRSYVAHAVYTIRPTLLNDAAFNFTRGAIQSHAAGLMQKALNPDINVAEPFTNTQEVVPTMAFSGASSLVGFGPYNEFNRNYNIFDSVTWIRGRHTFKFGVTANRYNKTENAAKQQGSFTFTFTGNPGSSANNFNQDWANFLLGNVSSFSMPSTDITPNLWAWQNELWAQDDFKVNSRLTVNVGVRWSYFGQPVDSHDMLDNFDPAFYNPANAPQINPANGNVVPGTGNNPNMNGIIVAKQNSPFGRKVGNDTYTAFAPRLGLAWDPFGNGKTSIRAGYGISYDAAEMATYELNIFNNPPFVQSVTYTNANISDITGGTRSVSVSPISVRGTQLPALIPYVQQWSLDIQRQLPKGIVFDAAYVGTKGTHLQGIVDLNQAMPGVALAAGLHAANGNTVFTTADDPRINAVRPYQGFYAINAIESGFDSNYHALQVQVRRNFGAAGLISGSYTYSKNLTDSGNDSGTTPQNTYNWREGEYGPAILDRTQVLTVNYVYTIPIFKTAHRLKRALLGGWELSGILSVYTGTPATVTTSNVDPAGLGFLGPSAAGPRPDMICDPNANAPHAYTGVLTLSTPPTWFNTSCFAQVPQGAIRPGNAGRGVLRTPGFGNLDGSVFKNIALTESGRVSLQLRGEAFNLTNHTNPSAFYSTNITSAYFGQITGFRAARRLQLGAKLTF